MKKISFAFTLLLLLGGCFGKGETTSLESVQTFTDPHFTLSYPSGWIVKTRQNFPPEIPQETVATFSRSEARDGYRTTMSVINELVPTGTSSLDYAKQNINNAVTGVLEFKKLEERDIELSGQKTKLLIFQGKSDLNAKKLQYVQVYLVQGQRGYTITSSDLLDIEQNDFKILQDLVLSFQLKSEKD